MIIINIIYIYTYIYISIKGISFQQYRLRTTFLKAIRFGFNFLLQSLTLIKCVLQWGIFLIPMLLKLKENCS